MILKALKFTRFKGEMNEWSIEGKPEDGEFGQFVTLETINLIVGKNASGKSRTVDSIRRIADLFAGDQKLSRAKAFGYGTCSYQLFFDDGGKKIEYQLDFKDGKISNENLIIDENEKLNRNKGVMYYEQEQKNLNFQIDDDLLAIARRDIKQQPFFESLYLWGKNLKHYQFGSQLGRDSLVRDMQIKDEFDVNLKNADEVSKVFIIAKQKFGDGFVDRLISDMRSIDYSLNKIDTSSIKYFPLSVYGLAVYEEELSESTDQTEMSQGMFRSLSLLIQLNYSLLSGSSSCILIDDIGEGLDYERSKLLIDLIINKVKDSKVQVIMTTNDRYVMNKIPLEYWSVIQRTPKKSLFYNYKNSKEIFEDFKYTGLNNFDFLSTEFYKTGFETKLEE